MDANHGNNIAGWDTGAFATGTWDPRFTHSQLAFDQTSSDANELASPEYLANAPINTQLPAQDAQNGVYRQFDYYGQPQVWPNNSSQATTTAAAATTTPATTSYGQDVSINAAYFPGQHHQADGSTAVNNRFDLNIQQQATEFSASQIDASAGQQPNAHHAFGNAVSASQVSIPENYPSQDSIPQWQGQMPTGYGPSHQRYADSIPPAAQPSVMSTISNGQPASFYSGQGPYQPDVPQQTQEDLRQTQPPFHSVLNGAPKQACVGVVQQQPTSARNVASSTVNLPPKQAHILKAPQQLAQHVSQQIPQQASEQMPQQLPHHVPQQVTNKGAQQVSQHIPQHVPQQTAQQPEHSTHHSAGQHDATQGIVLQQQARQAHPTQQVHLSLETNAVAGVKRSLSSEPQTIPAAVKKAKVVAVGAGTSPTLMSQSQETQAEPQVLLSSQSQPQTEQTTVKVFTVNFTDENLLGDAQRQPERVWAGVPNLVIGSSPVKLQMAPPAKRYVVLTSRGCDVPLFPDLWKGWTPAESLGNHAEAYKASNKEHDRQRADIRLEIETKRQKTSEWRCLVWCDVLRSSTDVRSRDPRRLVAEIIGTYLPFSFLK